MAGNQKSQCSLSWQPTVMIETTQIRSPRLRFGHIFRHCVRYKSTYYYYYSKIGPSAFPSTHQQSQSNEIEVVL